MKERNNSNMTFYHSKFGFKENFDILHAATVHEGKKLFKCDNCDANFGQKCSLNGHPLEFFLSYTILFHVEVVHEGKKQCKCVIL